MGNNEMLRKIEVFPTGSTVRSRLEKLGIAEAAVQRDRAAELKQKIDAVRQRVQEAPTSAESHYRLAVQLMSTVPQFSGLQTDKLEFWEQFRDASILDGELPVLIYSEMSDAEEHLNLALGLGLVDPLDRAKAYFLLYLLMAEYRTSTATKSGPRVVTLAKEVINETEKFLRRQPHHLEALQMQHTAYSWLKNERGMGKAEQAILQARALAKTRTPASEDSSPGQSRSSTIAKGQVLEEKMRALLRAMGLTAETTRATADGGIDVEAYSTDPIYAGKYLIQCKNWDNPVGESVVRDLYGVVMAENANKGILVTTGRFTAAAESFAQNKQLELIDGSTFRAMLRKQGLL